MLEFYTRVVLFIYRYTPRSTANPDGRWRRLTSKSRNREICSERIQWVWCVYSFICINICNHKSLIMSVKNFVKLMFSCYNDMPTLNKTYLILSYLILSYKTIKQCWNETLKTYVLVILLIKLMFSCYNDMPTLNKTYLILSYLILSYKTIKQCWNETLKTYVLVILLIKLMFSCYNDMPTLNKTYLILSYLIL